MLKRSFAEFHAQKKLPEKQQLLMLKLAQPTKTIEYVSSHVENPTLSKSWISLTNLLSLKLLPDLEVLTGSHLISKVKGVRLRI